MNTTTVKIVTVVAERVLRDRLLRELKALGARGFTVTDSVGEGSRGVRASDWEGYNVKIETIVSPEAAQRILEHVATHYFEHYAVIAYTQSADVVRSSKYAPPSDL